MVKKISSAFICGILLTVYGCSAPLPPKTVAINERMEKEMIIKKPEFNKNALSKNSILKYLAKNLLETPPNPTTYVERRSHGGKGSIEAKGAKVSVIDDKIHLEYVNGDRYDTQYGTSYDLSIFSTYLPVEVRENDDNFSVKISYPSEYKLQQMKNVFGVPIKFLMDETSSYNNLKAKFNNLNKILIPAIYQISGEVDLQWNADSIYSNFERKLAGIPNNYCREERCYHFNFRNTKLALGITAFPYRNGSKVAYNINIPYKISDNIDLTQEEITKIEKDIVAIAKD